jgi:hypothetical protein
MTEVLLKERDYTIIVAKTAVELYKAPPGYKNRWENAYNSIMKLVQACEELDTDGINVYVSCGDNTGKGFQQYKNVTSDKVGQVMAAHYPPEKLELFGVLQTALDDYFARKASGEAKPNGEIIIVLIDGEPSDRRAISKLIIRTTEKIASASELSIGFVQIGDDLIARGFLKSLDDDLTSAGAKFDIVDTKVLEDVEAYSLTEFLLNVIND